MEKVISLKDVRNVRHFEKDLIAKTSQSTVIPVTEENRVAGVLTAAHMDVLDDVLDHLLAFSKTDKARKLGLETYAVLCNEVIASLYVVKNEAAMIHEMIMELKKEK